MTSPRQSWGNLVPLAAATILTPIIYSQQTLDLLLKVGEVFSGVFDTSVPAYPLAGMLFTLMFVLLRRQELSLHLAERGREPSIMVAGVLIAAFPLVAILTTGNLLSVDYSFSGIALVCSWVGIAVALRPTLFKFLYPYLLIYLAAVGFVGVLTNAFGDPLALVVAGTSNSITTVFRQPVQWSSINIHFVAAGGTPVSLYISQECSGIASISIYLLLIGLMHLDIRPRARTSWLFAVAGSLLFLLLNALRVVGVILGGIYGGVDLMWSLHGWLGYALYIFGYSLIVLLFTRGKRAKPAISAQNPWARLKVD